MAYKGYAKKNQVCTERSVKLPYTETNATAEDLRELQQFNIAIGQEEYYIKKNEQSADRSEKLVKMQRYSILSLSGNIAGYINPKMFICRRKGLPQL